MKKTAKSALCVLLAAIQLAAVCPLSVSADEGGLIPVAASAQGVEKGGYYFDFTDLFALLRQRRFDEKKSEGPDVTDEQDSCPLCGKQHGDSFTGRLIGFIHRILYIIIPILTPVFRFIKDLSESIHLF